MEKGLFITVEGGDGSGKTTQLAFIKEYLTEKGEDVLFTREPGGTALGEKIRSVILDPANKEMVPMTESLLYAASRAQLVSEVIRPALAAGRTVVCDRYVDSSIAYQGYARGLGESVTTINGYAIGDCIPDATILIKVDPAKSQGISGARAEVSGPHCRHRRRAADRGSEPADRPPARQTADEKTRTIRKRGRKNE